MIGEASFRIEECHQRSGEIGSIHEARVRTSHSEISTNALPPRLAPPPLAIGDAANHQQQTHADNSVELRRTIARELVRCVERFEEERDVRYLDIMTASQRVISKMSQCVGVLSCCFRPNKVCRDYLTKVGLRFAAALLPFNNDEMI